MSGRVWVDVEDLFVYASEGFNRPTGIQRLAFELCGALQERHGASGQVQFVRHDHVRASFATVTFADLQTRFNRLSAPPPPSPPPVTVAVTPVAFSPSGMLARRAIYRLPVEIRQPLSRFARLQASALLAFLELLGNSARLVSRPLRRALRQPAPVRIDDAAPAASEGAAVDEPEIQGDYPVFRIDAAAGDVLFVVGAAWRHPDYAGLVRAACANHGVRCALLVYDIIPVRRPEFCGQEFVHAFTHWFDSLLPLCDTVLSISRASAVDVSRYAEQKGIALRRKIRSIPIGTGFSHAMAEGADESDLAEMRELPAPGSYALFVSTIEARKNHILLFRVWRRLCEELPRDAVPTLVFAGRVGWLVSDLMQQMQNTSYLNGKVMFFEHPTDRELEALYRGCKFTLFPSLYEGWGLPVTESLAFGKPCVVSNSTSLPEAGGTLARYFDPEDGNEAFRVIRAVIEAPDELARWEAEIRRDFRPVRWTETADAVMEALQPVPSDRPLLSNSPA